MDGSKSLPLRLDCFFASMQSFRDRIGKEQLCFVALMKLKRYFNKIDLFAPVLSFVAFREM